MYGLGLKEVAAGVKKSSLGDIEVDSKESISTPFIRSSELTR